MHTRYPMVVLIGATAFLLVTASGCSKSIQANSGAKSFEPGAKRTTTAAPAGTGSPTGSTSTPSAGAPISKPSDFARHSPPEPLPLEPSGLDSAPSSAPSLDGETSQPPQPLSARRSDQAQVPPEMLVAKAEPEDVSRRRVEEMQREQLATAAAGLEDVFFAFDSWQISNDGKQTLMLDAEWLKANPGRTITIEGHCDERGTLAYNLVLGEKRAKAVHKYLVELGVNPKQLSVVSYGKERPFCTDRDETCYQKNRRGHLVVRAQ